MSGRSRRFDKLRRDPARFFADARSPLWRRLGSVSAPLWRRELVRDLLLDPARALQKARIPLVSEAAGLARARAAERRRAAIAAAGSPLVSVITAAFNAAETLDDAIASVLDQGHETLELIVVDDGSADGTAEAARRWRERDPRVVVIEAGRNRGAAVARNLGLARARGDFVTFQDADDRSDPERLERQLEALLATGAVLAVCNSERVDDRGRRLEINGRSIAKAVISMMFRREPVLERVGFLRPMRVSEDAEYYERIRAAFGPDSEVVLHAPLLSQRFAPSSLLFSDGETRASGRRVEHRRSEAAERAWAEALERVERIRRGLESPRVDFDPEDPGEVSQ